MEKVFVSGQAGSLPETANREHGGHDRSLEDLFSPGSVAIVGASRSEGKLGHAVLSNVIGSGFGGAIYPINPDAEEILGLPCYPDVNAVAGDIDLAVVVIPAEFVLDVLETCGKKGVGAAIVISAGFRETGHEGFLAEKKMADMARRYGMPILGPNCLGLIDTLTPLNASFAAGMPRRGEMAFMSQSGALCGSVLDIALAQNVGFSRFVSLGNKADLTELDFLDAWLHDPDSKIVLAYLEGISDGTRFMKVARQLTKNKAFIAIKSGTTGSGARAVSSHTGTLAGSEKAYDTAFKQAGVIRAGSIEDLFDLAVGFSQQPLPKKETIAIVTNAGGPGIMASDAVERAGLALASLSNETMDALRSALPAAASVLNPVDLLGDAGADRYEQALNLIALDQNVGAIVVVLTPQVLTPVSAVAHAVGKITQRIDTPVFACFIGETNTAAGVRILRSYNVPNYLVPERAVAVIRAMVDQRRWREKPLPDLNEYSVKRDQIKQIFSTVLDRGRPQIGDTEARAVAQACAISMPASQLCATPEAAARFAESIGYPVVMKIASPDIFHKTDIGGVKLNIGDAGAVQDAFDLLILRAQRYMPDAELWGCLVQKQLMGGKEVIIGMNRDPQFGPLVMFGLGGIYVEVLKDVSFRIAPFSRQEALEMMEEIRAISLLRGFRGEAPSNLESVVETLLRISQLVTEFPEIVELDINPLMVFEKGRAAKAVDMRLVLAS